MNKETLKKIVELAEGFEWSGECEPAEDIVCFKEYIMQANDIQLFSGNILYPLLFHRAVDGWNIKNPVYSIELCSYCVEHFGKGNFMIINLHQDYEKTEYLTPQEQAIEACLIELLEVV